MRLVSLFVLATLAINSGCSSYATRVVASPPKPLAETAPATYARPCADRAETPASAYECDRRSILAMAGEFRVRFAFDETAALSPGYAPHAAQRSGGTELVLVIADTGDAISLQHILVLGKEHTIVKHWRQDWRWQPTEMLQFRGNGRFETVAVDALEARGNWSQTVYEVDDAPRYAAVGRWTHANGVDAWESQRTLRPLPRREYTKRSDYQALSVVNRHTLTPAGWVHEQDNTKLVLHADGTSHALAREHGINAYTRITDYDFAAGRDFWSKTAEFWAALREAWQQRITAHPRFATTPEPNGEPRINAIFALAEQIEKGKTIDPRQLREIVERYTQSETR